MYSLRRVELTEEELAEIVNELVQWERIREKHAQTLQLESNELQGIREEIEEKKSSSEDTSVLEQRLRCQRRCYDKHFCSVTNEILQAENAIKKLNRRTQELTVLYSGQAKEALRCSLADLCSKQERRQNLGNSLLPRILQLIDQFVKARQEEDQVKRLYGALSERLKSSGQITDQEINDVEEEVKDKSSAFWRDHPEYLSTDETTDETSLSGVDEQDKVLTSDSIRRIQRFLTELHLTNRECEHAPSSVSSTAAESACPRKKNETGPQKEGANP